MSRVAEIAVPHAVPSPNKPGRAETRDETRDPAGFSALIAEDATAPADAPGEAASPPVKASEGGEPSARAEHASARALMVTSLLAVPAADGATVEAADVIDAALLPDAALAHAGTSNGLPGAVTAVIAAVTEGGDQPADGSAEADAAPSGADSAVAASAAPAPDAPNLVVAVTVAPPIAVPTATDKDQQTAPAVAAVPADPVPPATAQSVPKLPAQTDDIPADAALPEAGALAPGEARAQVADARVDPRVVVARRDALKTVAAADPAIATAGKPETAAAPVERAAPEPTHKPAAPSDDGAQKDIATKADVAPASPADTKPAIAPAQSSPVQAQPAQAAPDVAALAPAAVHAAQPALLQAQLIATPAAPDAPVPVEGLAVEIAVRAASGKSRFEIRLDPPELGRIDVRLDIDRHGRVGTHLVVEKVETLDMLRRDAPQLERALSDAGLKTGDSGLQFSLRDQSFAGRGDQNEGRQQSARLIISDEDTVPASVAGRSYRMASAAGGLDIRV